MYIHINLDGVVIDATELAKYVALNEKNGSKYLTNDRDKAVGIMTSTDTIRQLTKSALAPDWYTVAQVVPVESIPEDYEPNKYRYEAGEFIEYEGVAPETNYELTVKVEAITPYTESKTGYLGDTEVVFTGVKEGNLSVFVKDENGGYPNYAVERIGDIITVHFEPLEYITTITISIQ